MPRPMKINIYVKPADDAPLQHTWDALEKPILLEDAVKQVCQTTDDACALITRLLDKLIGNRTLDTDEISDILCDKFMIFENQD